MNNNCSPCIHLSVARGVRPWSKRRFRYRIRCRSDDKCAHGSRYYTRFVRFVSRSSVRNITVTSNRSIFGKQNGEVHVSVYYCNLLYNARVCLCTYYKRARTLFGKRFLFKTNIIWPYDRKPVSDHTRKRIMITRMEYGPERITYRKIERAWYRLKCALFGFVFLFFLLRRRRRRTTRPPRPLNRGWWITFGRGTKKKTPLRPTAYRRTRAYFGFFI